MRYTTSLKKNYQFRRLYYRGKTAGNRLLVLYCRGNGQGKNRVGITVSAKLGNAVTRNRVRRRLREVYRLNETRFRPGYDIVVVARSRSVKADFSVITQAYLSAAKQLGLLDREV